MSFLTPESGWADMIEPLSWAAIFGMMAKQFWPVWVALAVTFAYPVAHREYVDKPRNYTFSSASNVTNSWMGS